MIGRVTSVQAIYAAIEVVEIFLGAFLILLSRRATPTPL
jgi:hypothetical protein